MIMTPKEKALELREKCDGYVCYAEVVVDEMLNSYYNVFDDSVIDSDKAGGYRNMKKYWTEVKQELEKI